MKTSAKEASAFNRFVHFAYNYPHNFIEIAFASQGKNMIGHLQSKFNNIYEKVGSRAVILAFYCELDTENKELFDAYVETLENHF